MMKDILVEWNPWWTEKYQFKGIPREKLKEILPWITRKEIIAVLGVRRSGKTTIFYEIIEHLIKNTDPKNILFIKADDDRVSQEGLINQAIETYKQLINPESKYYVFIDEVQEIPDWQKTIKRIYDLNPETKIFISGSNSQILQEELGALLAGRYAYFEIFPFSFIEYLKTKKIELDEINIIKNKTTIINHLNDYIKYGAFPEVILEEKPEIKSELAKFYFDSIFYRDVIKRKNIRNPAKMEKLVKYLLQNTANLTNYTKTAKILELTTDSITEYIRILEEAYLIFSINIYDFSYKKQVINPKKTYCVDTGIRNATGFQFSSDIGRLYENLVFINLRRKNPEIFYWKNKGECDFIIKTKNKLEAIQVCYEINNETKEKETNSLIEAITNFKLKEGLIITGNYEAEETINGKKIRFAPLWKWLLKE